MSGLQDDVKVEQLTMIQIGKGVFVNNFVVVLDFYFLFLVKCNECVVNEKATL